MTLGVECYQKSLQKVPVVHMAVPSQPRIISSDAQNVRVHFGKPGQLQPHRKRSRSALHLEQLVSMRKLELLIAAQVLLLQ